MPTGDLITCESAACVVVHIRRLGEKGPCYGGGADTLALCHTRVAWDTHLLVSDATCRGCRKVAGELAQESQ